jgi:hypothetical protein
MVHRIYTLEMGYFMGDILRDVIASDRRERSNLRPHQKAKCPKEHLQIYEIFFRFPNDL